MQNILSCFSFFFISFNASFFTHFYSVEIFFLVSFLCFIVYTVILRLSSYNKEIIFNFFLFILIIGFFLITVDMDLFSSAFGIQELQSNFYLKVIILIFTLVYLFFIKSFFLTFIRSFDFLYFIFLIIIGALGLISFNDLLMIFLCLELISLSSYVLVAYENKSLNATEASIKYLIIGGFSTLFFLLGIAFLYFIFGITNLTLLTEFYVLLDNDLVIELKIVFYLANFFLISSLLLKLGAAPFHFWLADIYEGSSSIVAFFLSLIPKISIFFLLLKFSFIFDINYDYMLFIIYNSLLFGSFLALYQKKTKRFIAYSSITHIGFLLLPVLAGLDNYMVYSTLYFFHYIIITFLLWGGLFLLNKDTLLKKRTMLDFSSIFFIKPLFSFSLLAILLSLAGVPPFIGFWAKFWALVPLFEIQAFFLIFFILIISIVTIQYYVKILKLVFYEDMPLSFYSKSYKIAILCFTLGLFILIISSLFPFYYFDFTQLSLLHSINFFFLSLLKIF